MAPDNNICESEDIIRDIIEQARDCALQEEKVDLSTCYSLKAREDNRRFIREHNIKPYDIRSFLSSLRIEEYCETSRETEKEDAYVFGIEIEPETLAYFKFSFRNGVLVLSFHEPKRVLSFPYRKGKSR